MNLLGKNKRICGAIAMSVMSMIACVFFAEYINGSKNIEYIENKIGKMETPWPGHSKKSNAPYRIRLIANPNLLLGNVGYFYLLEDEESPSGRFLDIGQTVEAKVVQVQRGASVTMTAIPVVISCGEGLKNIAIDVKGEITFKGYGFNDDMNKWQENPENVNPLKENWLLQAAEFGQKIFTQITANSWTTDLSSAMCFGKQLPVVFDSAAIHIKN